MTQKMIRSEAADEDVLAVVDDLAAKHRHRCHARDRQSSHSRSSQGRLGRWEQKRQRGLVACHLGLADSWSTGRSPTIRNAIDAAFREASWQLGQVKPDGYDRVSFVFVSPRVEDPANFDVRIGDFLAVLDAIDDTASVWTFPTWARNHAIQSEVTGMYYPGAALLARHERARTVARSARRRQG